MYMYNAGIWLNIPNVIRLNKMPFNPSESQPQIFETQQTKRVLDSEASTGCVPYAELFGVTESAPLCVKL